MDTIHATPQGGPVRAIATELPSFYFRRQCWSSGDPDEKSLPAIIPLIGEDRFFWASDFPHADHPPDYLRNLEELAPKFDADGTRDAEFASEGEGPGGVDGDEAGADLGADAEGEAAPVDDALAVFADVKPVGEPH